MFTYNSVLRTGKHSTELNLFSTKVHISVAGCIGLKLKYGIKGHPMFEFSFFWKQAIHLKIFKLNCLVF